MLEDQHQYLDSLKQIWIEQKNPFWVWVAIKTSCHNKHSLPNWACDYLEDCADQLLSPKAFSGDFARKLPRMFGFSLKSGPRHPRKISARMLENERFAMAFAKHILNEEKPSDARTSAANECEGRWPAADDKTLQAALRDHFKLERAPRIGRAWKKIIIRWLIDNPLYRERYPDLPMINVLVEKLAAISRDSSVTQ
jgi:hypothetical protein